MTVVDSASTAPTEEVLATAEALQRNGFAVHVVPTAEAAHALATTLVPRGAEVFTATSVTLDETGLSKTFNGEGYAGIRNTLTSLAGDPANKKAMKRLVSAVDYVVSSVHAVTRDGRLLVASASGSQLGIQAYGADKVLFVIGTQKIVDDVTAGVARIENHVVPLEDTRALAAYGTNTRFSKLMVLNNELPGRVTVILVEEPLGY
jgi:hypothetical protein